MKTNKMLLLLVFVVLMLSISACRWNFNADGEEIASGEFNLDVAVQMVKNIWNKDEAETTEEPEVAETEEPEVAETEEPEVAETEAPEVSLWDQKIAFCKTLITDLGSTGSYHAVYDSNLDTCVLDIDDETAIVREGTGLSVFKQKAHSVEFTLDYPAMINNSAAHIAVDGIEWNLGNPIVDSEDNSNIPEKASISIWSDGPNDSMGFKIIYIVDWEAILK